MVPGAGSQKQCSWVGNINSTLPLTLVPLNDGFSNVSYGCLCGTTIVLLQATLKVAPADGWLLFLFECSNLAGGGEGNLALSFRCPSHHLAATTNIALAEVGELSKGNHRQTSLLHRLQAQTLPDAIPPIGQIHPFSKMVVTFEPLKGFGCPLGSRKVLITNIYNWKCYPSQFGRGTLWMPFGT